MYSGYRKQGYQIPQADRREYTSESYEDQDFGNAKCTLRRQANRSKQSITLIGRVRALEDDLVAERVRNQQLEHKCFQYARNLEQLRIEFVVIEEELQRAKYQELVAPRKSQEIRQYERNIINIGVELNSLNQCLMKKNKQYQLIIKENNTYQSLTDHLKDQNASLRSQQLQVQSEIYALLELLGLQTSQEDSIRGEIDIIRKTVLKLKQQCRKGKELLDRSKKEFMSQVLSEKEKYIKLQYQLKLIQQRDSDHQRKAELIQMNIQNSKFEEIIENMLKKEDQMSQKVQDLIRQNEGLKSQYERQIIQRQKKLAQHYQQQKKQYQTLLTTYQQSRERQSHCRKHHQSLSEQYQKVIQQTDRETARELETDRGIMKRLRTSEEENKLIKLKLQELEHNNLMLKKQVSILKE